MLTPILTEPKPFMKEDKQLLMLTHLSQLLDLATGFGGILVPIIIWVVKKDEIFDMDEQGKGIINFRISMLIYAFVCIPLVFVLGVGILGIIAIVICTILFPIVNTLRVRNNQEPNYPFSFQFLK